jgi:hypothetical protein
VVETACGTWDQGQFSIPIVASDGTVHVFWQGLDYDSAACTGNRAIRHAYSTDGGATFTPDSVAFLTSLGYWDVDGAIDIYGMPNGDADISGGPYDGNLYIARTEFTPDLSGETNVVVHTSTDNGVTWLDTVTVNDDPPHQNIDQFHPWLAVNEDGTILMIFYDQRNDPVGHYLFDCYFSASFDGAETFITNYRLSSVSSSPANLAALRSVQVERNAHDPAPGVTDPTVTLNPMAGAIAEYIGVHAKHDYAVAVWTDTRNGNQDVFSTRFTIPFLKPRLYAPEDGSQSASLTPAFRWSTCWHETEDSYRLEVTTDPTFAVIDETFAGLTDNSFTPGSPLPSAALYWRVKAFRSAGDSTEYSDVFTFSAGCTVGAAPILVAPGPGEVFETTAVLLDWDPVLDAISYRLQLSDQVDFLATMIDTLLTETEVFATGLADATVHYWRVNSTNDCGPGDWSQSDFSVVLCPIALTGDVNVNGTITSSDVIELVNYVFKGGSVPQPCEAAGDVDCSEAVTSADIIYVVNYVFKGGAEPCDVCTLVPGVWTCP